MNLTVRAKFRLVKIGVWNLTFDCSKVPYALPSICPFRRALPVLPTRHMRLSLIPWAAAIALDTYILAGESICLLPVPMPISWSGTICTEWGVWGQRALSYPQRRQEKDIGHFDSFQNTCFEDLDDSVPNQTKPCPVSHRNPCTTATMQVWCWTPTIHMRQNK